MRDRVARRVVDTACIEGGTDNDERKRSLMADTGRCGTPSAPLGALTSRRTHPAAPPPTRPRVCAPDSARRPPGPMCADRVGATRFAPRARDTPTRDHADARNRATGLETHTEAVSTVYPSAHATSRPRHVTPPPVSVCDRHARPHSTDRPRRATPHHVRRPLPTAIAPHETKTPKPGAVTLVIVPQTAGMPHRPL